MSARTTNSESEGGKNLLSRVATKSFDSNDPVFKRALGEATLRFRRTLMVVSGVALVAALGDLFPTGIPSLGISVGADDRLLIDWVTMVSIVYLLAQFLVNAYVDLVKWVCAVVAFMLAQQELMSAVNEIEKEEISGMDQFLKSAFGRQPGIVRQLSQVMRSTDGSTKIQLLFDLVVPVTMAIGSLAALLVDVIDAI